MGVRTAVQPQQLGQIGGSVEIAADALADEVALTAEGDDVRLAERLMLVRLAQQHLALVNKGDLVRDFVQIARDVAGQQATL